MIPPEIKKQKEQIEWKKIAGMRDNLIHHSFGVDYALVWDVIKSHLPNLKSKIILLLDKE